MDKIPVHWLHNQAFCEYEIYLAHNKGIPDPDPVREDLKKGKAIHDASLEEHNAKAIETNKSVIDLSQEAKSIGKTSILRELFVIGNRMVGSIDEVKITPKNIYIIEDKPKSKRDPFISETRQAQGYALIFKECYSLPQNIIVVIRDRDNFEYLWQKALDDKDIQSVNESLDRIEGIISGTRQAQPTRNPNKCHYCRWNLACDRMAG